MDSSHRLSAMASFVQTAERGSLAAAARTLGISSAAVSKNISGLETTLGVRLMHRTTRALKLTLEGATFLEHAKVAITALDDAMDAVAQHRAQPGGRVRITSSTAFGRDHLLPLLPSLQTQFPDLQLEVDLDDRRVDLIQEGYDLALRGGVQDASLVSRKIAELRTILVASPQYLREHGIPDHLEDLMRHRVIAVRFISGRLSKWTFQWGRKPIQEWTPTAPVITVSAPESAVQLSAMGMGIAQVGVHHAWPYLRSGQLKVVLAHQHHPGARELSLQYPPRAGQAPRVKVTIQHLLDGMKHAEALNVTQAQLKQHWA